MSDGRRALTSLVAELKRLVEQLDPFLRTRARPLWPEVPVDLAPDPATGRISCELERASRQPCAVTVRPRDGRLAASCSCGYFAAHGQCKHVAAVVTILVERLSGARRARGAGVPDPAAAPDLLNPARGGVLRLQVRLGHQRVDVVPIARREVGAPLELADDAAVRAALARDPTHDERGLLERLLAPLGGRAPGWTGEVLRALVGRADVELAGRAGVLPVVAARAGLAVVPLAGERYAIRPALDGRAVALWPGKAALSDDVLAAALDVGDAASGSGSGPDPGSGVAARLAFARLTPAASSVLSAAAAQWSDLAVETLLVTLDALERASEGLDVHVPPGLEAREVPPSARVSLVVSPEPEGAIVAMRVRPLEGGPLELPGVGAARRGALVGGERRVTTRRLDDEVRAAEALEAALRLPPADEGREWELATDEAVLDLLARLNVIGLQPGVEPPLVEWPRGATRLRGLVTPGPLRVSARQATQWLELTGGVEVEGGAVQLAVLLEAAREGRRYAAVGDGRYVELARVFAGRLQLLALLADDAPARAVGADDEAEAAVQLPRVTAPLVAELLTEAGLDEGAALAERVARAASLAASPDAGPPPGFVGELRPYQLEGLRWLRRLALLGAGGVLADEMGLGKTVQAAALLLDRAALGPALVVAPTSVLVNWQRELARFAPSLRVLSYAGAERAALLDASGRPPGAGDVVLCSWAVQRLDHEALAAVPWATRVLDEAQTAKNATSRTARAARSVGAELTVALTGTPLENHLGELHALFDLVVPGLLGPWSRFAARFAEPIESGADPARAALLARLVRPFLLRRTKDVVARDLPPLLTLRVDVDLSPAERAVYEQVRLDALSDLLDAADPEARRVRLFAALTRLRQAACHPRLVDPHAPPTSSKLDALLARLDAALALAPGAPRSPRAAAPAPRRALVFSQFVRHLELVRDALHARGHATLLLTGDQSAAERARVVDVFSSPTTDARVLLISLRAGGTGLNLAAADLVLHLDPWWNPAVEDQATARAHRLGQTRPVTVLRLVARDTIEDKVLALHAHKRALVDGVLDGSGAAAGLDTDQLLELMREGRLPDA